MKQIIRFFFQYLLLSAYVAVMLDVRFIDANFDNICDDRNPEAWN